MPHRNESRIRFEAVFHSAAHGMALVAPDGQWLRVNSSLCAILGYSEVELLSSTFQDLTHPDDLDKDLELREETLSGKRHSYQMEKRYLRRDGAICWALLTVSLIRDKNGDPAYFVSQIIDLTQLKQAEVKLAQAQKMEAIGQLTGGIAHDFNNLLTIISGNLELLIQRICGDQRSEERVRAALDAASRGADLTQRMLAFARRQPLEPRPLDVSELFGDLERLIHRTIGEQVGLRFETAPDLWLAQADRSQLESALINLVINARDSMSSSDQRRLTIAASNFEAKVLDPALDLDVGEYVAISVCDSGSGMDDRTRRRALEPFFTTKGPGEGSGLGLSMVYGFVRQSDGELYIDSAIDEGTTVTMYLPRASEVPEAMEDGSASVDHVRTPAKKAVVLIVEDDDAVRALSVSLVEELGFDSLEAHDADSALELAQNHGIDVIFSDMVMPGRSGIELAQALRQDRPDLPVILTSGYSDTPTWQRSELPQDWIFLNKPYALRDLDEALREALSRSRA